MTKVLYLGVYKDSGGWAQATRNYILSLDAVGVNVVPRPIIFSKSSTPPPKRILDLEKQSAVNSDVVCQHILPHMMEYSGRFKKNIGVYCSETSNFSMSSWPEKLNAMDNLWVCSEQMKTAATSSHVNKPVHVLPYSTDTQKFSQSYKPLNLKKTDDTFIFYTISSAIRRKNLAALIKAFHITFEPYEPVELLIKTEPFPNTTFNDAREGMFKFCSQIKEGLKIRKSDYKNEIIIVDNLAEEEVRRLHFSCDCFVSASYGEAWCLPAMDAMGFGKTPIVPNWGGFREYVTHENGWLVPVHEEPAFGMHDTFDDLYTSRENCGSISVPELCIAMREAYEKKSLREEKGQAGMEKIYEYSYEIVGEKLKKVLLE